MDIAVVGCGINVTLDDKGVCTAARVALGAVAPTVILVPDAADALIGHTLDDDTLAKLDAAAQAACQADQRQARHRSNTAPRSPACWPAASPRSRSIARRAKHNGKAH